MAGMRAGPVPVHGSLPRGLAMSDRRDGSPGREVAPGPAGLGLGRAWHGAWEGVSGRRNGLPGTAGSARLASSRRPRPCYRVGPAERVRRVVRARLASSRPPLPFQPHPMSPSGAGGSGRIVGFVAQCREPGDAVALGSPALSALPPPPAPPTPPHIEQALAERAEQWTPRVARRASIGRPATRRPRRSACPRRT